VQDEDPPDDPEAPGPPVRADGDPRARRSRSAGRAVRRRAAFVRVSADSVGTDRQDPVNSSRPLLSLGLDLDNLWAYMKIHGDAGWDRFPSYLDILCPAL